MTTRHIARRIAATLALLALPFAGVAGTAATAQAAEPGSIQIVDQHNLATGGSVGVQDAVFTVSLISGVDPTTDAGVTQFRQYQQLVEAGQSSQVPVSSVYDPSPTDATGTTTVGNLPVGAYLIHESGVLDSAGKLTTPADPVSDFLVSLPTADDSGDPVYNLVVMPKTSIGAPVPTPSSSATPSASSTPSASATPTSSATPSLPRSTSTSTSTSTITVQPPASYTTVTMGARTQTQYQTQTQTQNNTSPNSTHINSGDGADFGGGVQWATIAFAVALIAVAFIVTGRRRHRVEEKH